MTPLLRAAVAPTGHVTAFDHAPPHVVHGALRRATGMVGDVLGAAAIILCIPLALLVVGVPLALGVRAVLWVSGLL